MLTKKEFLDVAKQNKLTDVGILRKKYIQNLCLYLKRKEILILKGVRRCGKTTIIKQLIRHLLVNENVKKENILYVNLDDRDFLMHRSIDLLDLALSTRNLKEKQYVFFDEIQTIPNFEVWLKTYYDRGTNIKFIISGSESDLLEKEKSYLLTGRNITFEIFPLSYNEFKDFRADGSLEEYLEFGGFPEVVLEENEEIKLKLLESYLDNIIKKDILHKRQIRNPEILSSFAEYLIGNPGLKLSINKVSKELGISKGSTASYLRYLMDAYILLEVNYFSYSVKSKFHKAKRPKYYPIDNGFYRLVSRRYQKGNLAEKAVAIHLRKTGKPIYYWSHNGAEVDFVQDDIAINVTTGDKIKPREVKGIFALKESKKYVTDFKLVNQNRSGNEKEIDYVLLSDFLCSKSNG